MTDRDDAAEARRKNQVIALVSDMKDLFRDLGQRYGEVTEIGVDPLELYEMLTEDPAVKDTAERFSNIAKIIYGGFMADDEQDSPFVQVFARLLEEAPKMTDAFGRPTDDQTPAFEGALVLRSGREVQGAISKTPEGCIRVMSMGNAAGGKNLMIEHFFEIEDIELVAVPREVSLSQGAPTIWTGRG